MLKPPTDSFRASVGPIAAVVAAAQAAAGAELDARQRLAREFSQAAIVAVSADPLTVQALAGALVLIREAVLLDPGHEELWRTCLRVADLAEEEALASEALDRLVRLDPDDEVIRLRYLMRTVERAQTIDERVDSYTRLLDPARRTQVGAAVASRLAADLATLLYRSGDARGYGRWLAEAVTLDPSNRAAAAEAAGFFRANLDDPYAAAELLTAVLLSDPTDYLTLSELAGLLLEHGAYDGADRLFKAAVRTQTAVGRPASIGLVADWAVAMWARGDTEPALDLMLQRQRAADAIHRSRLVRENPALGAIDLARLPRAPLDSTMATIRAAIRSLQGGEEAAARLDDAIAAHRAEIEALRASQSGASLELRVSCLEAAWVVLWLGGDPRVAAELLGEAEASGTQELSPAARARFEGWMALRSGEAVRAAGLLEPLAGSDPAARLGLALAELKQGRAAPAARGLLEVARSRPGTAMGVWAAYRLREIVGQMPQRTPLAARLEDLAKSIPSLVDRLCDDPTLAVSLRILTDRTTFAPYEPMYVRLEISNNAPVPLAIDRGGPIGPTVAILPEVQVSHVPAMPEVPPIIVAIDRRLRLGPRERLVIPVDLRQGTLLQRLDSVPLPGATVKVRAVINYALGAALTVRPGVLGSEVLSPPLRVDGVRVSQPWLSASVAAVLQPDSPADLTTMALLAHVVGGRPGEDAESHPAAVRQLLQDGSAALAEGFAKLSSAERAWLLAVVPHTGLMEPLFAMARKDPNKHVRMSYLLFCLRGADDPMLDAAKRGSDPDVATVALLMEHGAARAAAARQQ